MHIVQYIFSSYLFIFGSILIIQVVRRYLSIYIVSTYLVMCSLCPFLFHNAQNGKLFLNSVHPSLFWVHFALWYNIFCDLFNYPFLILLYVSCPVIFLLFIVAIMSKMTNILITSPIVLFRFFMFLKGQQFVVASKTKENIKNGSIIGVKQQMRNEMLLEWH